jgi:hypothetical protein
MDALQKQVDSLTVSRDELYGMSRGAMLLVLVVVAMAVWVYVYMKRNGWGFPTDVVTESEYKKRNSVEGACGCNGKTENYGGPLDAVSMGPKGHFGVFDQNTQGAGSNVNEQFATEKLTPSYYSNSWQDKYAELNQQPIWAGPNTGNQTGDQVGLSGPNWPERLVGSKPENSQLSMDDRLMQNVY